MRDAQPARDAMIVPCDGVNTELLTRTPFGDVKVACCLCIHRREGEPGLHFYGQGHGISSVHSVVYKVRFNSFVGSFGNAEILRRALSSVCRASLAPQPLLD